MKNNSVTKPASRVGYSLNKQYTRMTVWLFGANCELIATLKYSYKPQKGDLRRSKTERFNMFCGFLAQNDIPAPKFQL